MVLCPKMGRAYSEKADDVGQAAAHCGDAGELNTAQAAGEAPNAVLAAAGAINTVQTVTDDSGAGELHTTLAAPKGGSAVLAAGLGRATAEQETADAVQTVVRCGGSVVFYTAHVYVRKSEQLRELEQKRRERLRCC